MAITMNLYTVSDDPRVVGKTKTGAGSTTITLKDGCSIDRPVVTFSASIASVANVNYAYISTFHRYYWIVDRKSLVNGMVEFSLVSDPWESFASQLRACPATIVRNENTGNGYLIDNSYQLLAYNQIVTRTFPVGLTEDSMILLGAG